MRNSIFSLLALTAVLLTGCTRDDEIKREHKELGDKITTQPAR